MNQVFDSQMIVEQNMQDESDSGLSLIDQSFRIQSTSKVIKDSNATYTLENQYVRIKITQVQSTESNGEDTGDISDLTDLNETKQSEILIDTKTNIRKYHSDFEKYNYQLIGKPYYTTIIKNGFQKSSTLNDLVHHLHGDAYVSPFQDMYELNLFFPDYYLKKGDVWHKEISIESQGKSIQGNIRFQLESWNDSSIYILMKSTLTGRLEDFSVGNQVSVEKKGTIVLDRKTCWVIKAHIEQKTTWPSELSGDKDLIGTVQITNKLR